MDVEAQLTAAESDSKAHTEDPEEAPVVLEKKIIETPKNEPSEAIDEDVNPLNNSIEDILKSRADERRRKMKEFNYKFRNNAAKIDEIEKEPAYKRHGIALDDTQPSSEDSSSRMSLGTDSNDDIQLRSNNSFLHDNVD
jgi:cell division protein FtsZ